jgi:hypothetical protein
MIVREKTTLYFYPNISFYVTSKSATFSTVLMNLIFKSKNLLIYALLRWNFDKRKFGYKLREIYIFRGSK